MQIDVAIFFGVIILVCFIFACFTKNNKVFGIFGGVLLLVSSLLIITGGLQVQNGSVSSGSSSDILSGAYYYSTNNTANTSAGNVSIVSVTSSSNTETFSYSSLSFPYMVFNNDFGLIFLALSIYTIIVFSFGVADQKN